ncbi:MAG: sigma 54-interacting transcriptional regulator [Polyangiaceae bacterium]|jgi:transcriptional regulator with GAF, ATPase, and Fis domain
MQLEALQSLALSVAAARSPDSVLAELVRGLGMTAGVALARVWLLKDEATGVPHLELKASVGTSIVDPSLRWTRTDGAHHRIPLNYGKVGLIASTNAPLLLQRGPRDWVLQPEWAEAEAIESFAGQPLAFRGQVLGVVAIFSRRRLEMEDLKWIRVFADHAAVAVANARAFEEIERLKERAERERDYLREVVRTALAQDVEIVAVSASMKRLLLQAEQVAQTDSSVLILGESGVGKELVAAAIHRMSPRRDGPLVRVNCASIPHELFESEFFGHVRGAFSGAIRDRQGRFLLADGGTLFLDEVGEIPMDLQSKLLRVLQERTFEPVGDDRTRTVNVRVIAATNRSLEREVERGRFRRDLYYRLNVLPLEVPPLRERRDDILPMARSFLKATARRLSAPEPVLDAAAEKALLAYEYPGNARELQNVIERAVVLAPTRRGALRVHLTRAAPSADREAPAADSETIAEEGEAPPREELGAAAAERPLEAAASASEVVPMTVLRERERRNILNALARCDHRIAGAHGAAQMLGMSPSTLAYHIKRLGLRRPNEAPKPRRHMGREK